MTAKGTIKVEDGRRIAGAVVLNIDNVFHMQEEEKGKKKGTLKNSRSLRTCGNYFIPQHFLETNTK